MSDFPVQLYSAPVVTALPTNPADGDVIHYLADGTNGVVWMLKYRVGSGSAYKWEYIGGAALFAEGGGAGVTPGDITSTTYVTFTNNISLTAPLAGDYIVDHGSASFHTVSGASLFLVPVVGGSLPANDNNATCTGIANSTGAGSSEQMSVVRKARFTGVAANAVIDLRGRTTTPTGKPRNYWMALTPVRVG